MALNNLYYWQKSEPKIEQNKIGGYKSPSWKFDWQNDYKYDDKDPYDAERKRRGIPPKSFLSLYDFTNKKDKDRFNSGEKSILMERGDSNKQFKAEMEAYQAERQRKFDEVLKERQAEKGWFGRPKKVDYIDPEEYKVDLPSSLAAWRGYLDKLDEYQSNLKDMEDKSPEELAYRKAIGSMPKEPEQLPFDIPENITWDSLNSDLWEEYLKKQREDELKQKQAAMVAPTVTPSPQPSQIINAGNVDAVSGAVPTMPPYAKSVPSLYQKPTPSPSVQSVPQKPGFGDFQRLQNEQAMSGKEALYNVYDAAEGHVSDYNKMADSMSNVEKYRKNPMVKDDYARAEAVYNKMLSDLQTSGAISDEDIKKFKNYMVGINRKIGEAQRMEGIKSKTSQKFTAKDIIPFIKRLGVTAANSVSGGAVADVQYLTAKANRMAEIQSELETVTDEKTYNSLVNEYNTLFDQYNKVYKTMDAGSETANKVADTIGSLLGLATPIPGAGFTKLEPFRPIGETVAEQVGKPISKMLVKSAEKGASNAAIRGLYFAYQTIPVGVGSAAQFSIMQAANNVIDANYRDLSTEEKLKSVGNSALWGFALGTGSAAINEAVKVAGSYVKPFVINNVNPKIRGLINKPWINERLKDYNIAEIRVDKQGIIDPEGSKTGIYAVRDNATGKISMKLDGTNTLNVGPRAAWLRAMINGAGEAQPSGEAARMALLNAKSAGTAKSEPPKQSMAPKPNMPESATSSAFPSAVATTQRINIPVGTRAMLKGLGEVEVLSEIDDKRILIKKADGKEIPVFKTAFQAGAEKIQSQPPTERPAATGSGTKANMPSTTSTIPVQQSDQQEESMQGQQDAANGALPATEDKQQSSAVQNDKPIEAGGKTGHKEQGIADVGKPIEGETLDPSLISRANDASVMNLGDAVNRTYLKNVEEVRSMNISEDEKANAIKKIKELSEKELKYRSLAVNPYVSGPAVLTNDQMSTESADKAVAISNELEGYMKQLRRQSGKNAVEQRNKSILSILKEAETKGEKVVKIDGKTYYKLNKNWTIKAPSKAVHTGPIPEYSTKNAVKNGQEPPTGPVRPSESAPIQTQGAPSENSTAATPESQSQSPADTKAQQPDTADETNNVVRVNPKDIKVDPKRFQFKQDVDPKTGAGKSLDISQWDDNLAGVVLVWEDKSGDRYVVNGHHRLQKAKELGVDGINAMVIREKDGYTDKDAKLIGAKVNIAEGHGSLVDAAKLFRDGGYTLDKLKREGLPMSSGNAAKGYALAQLTDNLFNKVVNKTISENQGAIIGEKIPSDGGVNDARQEFILKQLTNKDMTNSVLSETIDAIINVQPSNEMQETLFGSELVWNTADFEIKPKIIAETKRLITSNKNAFSKTIQNAEALKKAGNVLQDEANKTQKDILEQSLEFIDKGKYAKGDPISEIFNKASAHVQAGGNIKTASEQAAQDIVSLIAKGEYISSLTGKSPSQQEETPGQMSLLGGEESGERGIQEASQKVNGGRVSGNSKAVQGRKNQTTGGSKTEGTALARRQDNMGTGRYREQNQGNRPRNIGNAKADARGVLSIANREITEKFGEKFGKEVNLTLAKISEDARTQLKALEGYFGVKALVVESNPDIGINGFQIGKRIFILDNKPVVWVYGHELFHAYSRIAPDIVKSYSDRIGNVTREQMENYAREISKDEAYIQELLADPELCKEEMIADFFADTISGTYLETFLAKEQKKILKQYFTEIVEKLSSIAEQANPDDTLLLSARKSTWDKDFPPVAVQTNINTLMQKDAEAFKAAKAGDIDAAVKVLNLVAKRDKIKELGKKYPGAIVVSVHAEEAAGLNMLPTAYARLISDITGLELDKDIIQVNRAQRTNKGAADRLRQKVEFDGEVRKGYNYIIADDVFTMGGTLADLKDYIESNGGNVVSATTLAMSKGNRLAPNELEIHAMEVKFGRDNLEQLLREEGIAETLESLTAPEARYILKFRDVDSLRDRISQEKQTGSNRISREKETLDNLKNQKQEAKKRPLFSTRELAPAFYSRLTKTIEDKLPKQAYPQAVLGLLRSSQVKAEEVKWSGIDDWLKDKKGKVSKDEILNFLRMNELQIEGVSLSEEDQRQASKEYRDWLYNEAFTLNQDDETISIIDNEANDILYISLNADDAYEDKISGETFYDYEEALEYAESKLDELRHDYQDNPESYREGKNRKPMYEQYVLPGGENYRELLFLLPTSKTTSKYQSGHWPYENVLAHTRIDDRTGANGEKILFIEEIQSDWHQAGRKHGYKSENDKTELHDLEEEKKEILSVAPFRRDPLRRSDAFKNLTFEQQEKYRQRLSEIDAQIQSIQGKVPDAPFQKTWHEFVLKRLLRYAAEGGYDAIAWTNGKQQNDRYNLSKQISKITLRDNSSYGVGAPSMEGDFKVGTLKAYDKNGKEVISKYINSPEELADHIGKEAAQKLMEAQPVAATSGGMGVRERSLSGLDLDIGGSGMKGFYDKMIPDFLNKYGKKWGARVNTVDIGALGKWEEVTDDTWNFEQSQEVLFSIDVGPYEYTVYDANNDEIGRYDTLEEAQGSVDVSSNMQPSLPITDAMKESFLFEGQPMFSVRELPPPKKTITAYKLFRVDPKHKGELFPLFVDANNPTPTGVWLDAEEGPTVVDGKGNVKVKSKLGNLAYRPGWHLGDIPLATHIGVRGKSGEIEFMNPYHVWAEAEVAADVDYQDEANKNGINPNTGKINKAKADIKHLPVNGYYRFKTNPNMTGEWIITGAIKINRILTDKETADILARHGYKPMPRPDGKPLDLKEFGLGKLTAVSESKTGSSNEATREDVVNTAEFKQWFRNSKVVDKNGKPLVVYHGTADKTFNIFEHGKTNPYSLYGGGFYFTEDKSIGETYATKEQSSYGIKDISPDNGQWDYGNVKKLVDTTQKMQEELEIKYGRDKLSSSEYVDKLVNLAKEDPKTSNIMSSLNAFNKFGLQTYSNMNIDSRQRERFNDYKKDKDYIAVESADKNTGYVIEKYELHSLMGESDEMKKLLAERGASFNVARQTPGVFEAYLSMEKPLDVDNHVLTADEQKAFGIAFEVRGLKQFKQDNPASYKEQFGGYPPESLRTVFLSLEQSKQYEKANDIRKNMKSIVQGLGYDGLTHIGGWNMGGKPHRVWIAYEPNQIKSATDNIGTFDVNNPDIRSSRREFTESDKKQFNQLKSGSSSGIQGKRTATASALSDMASGKPVSRAEIVDFISKTLDIPIKQGKFRQHALGIFKVHPEVIRLKKDKDLETLYHEVGHALDKWIGLNDSRFSWELYQMGLPASGPNYTKKEVVKEGIAEFLMHYLTNPDHARSIAPRFYAFFESKINNNLNYKDMLGTVQAATRNYINQDPEHRVDGNISLNQRHPRLLDEATPTKLYTAIIDELHPIKKAVEGITGGAPVAIQNDPFKLAWLYRGVAGKATAILEYGPVDKNLNKIGESFANIINDIDDINAFRRYAVSKHSKELLEKDKATGLLESDINYIIQKYDEKYEPILKRLVTYQNNVMLQLVDSGILSKDSYDNITAAYEYYVPFYRVMDGMKKPFMGKGFESRNPVYKIVGSERDIIDPFESIIKNTFMFTMLADRNRVGRALVDLADAYEGSGKFLDKVPPRMVPTTFNLIEIKKALQEVGLETEGIDLDMMAKVFRPRGYGRKDNVITVFKDGKPTYYEVFDEDLYRAFTAMDKEVTPLVIKILSIPARTLRAGATALNLEFIGRNIFKDTFSAGLFSQYNFIPVLDSIKGLFSAIGKDEYFEKWLYSGGSGSEFISLNRDKLQQEFNKLRKESQTNKKIKIITNPLDFIEAWGEFSEQATRLGVYKKALKKEGNDLEGMLAAALASRDTTTDFSRTGPGLTRQFNKIAAFFNANLQGVDLALRVAKRDKGKFLLRSLLYITIPAIALYLVCKDDPEYEEMPQYRKDLFFMFKTGDTWWNIPTPYEWGVLFAALPIRALRYLNDNDPKAFDGWAEQFKDTILPNYIPTVFLPMMEVMTNTDTFRNIPIVPEGEKYKKPSDQYGPYTSSTAKAFGKIFNVSPRIVDHLIRGYAGGVGMSLANTLGKGFELVGAVEKKVEPSKSITSKIPVIRGLTYDAYRNSQSVNDFYTELNDLETEYKRERDDKDIELWQFKDSKRLREMRKAQEKLRDLRKEYNSVYADNKISSKQKQERLSDINLKMINVARQALGKPKIKG